MEWNKIEFRYMFFFFSAAVALERMSTRCRCGAALHGKEFNCKRICAVVAGIPKMCIKIVDVHRALIRAKTPRPRADQPLMNA